MRGSDFIFDSVQLMHYKCHRLSFKRGGCYIDSSDWIKHKKPTINPQNDDDKCFQYATAVASNYKETESHPERVSYIRPFINKPNWEGINSPSKLDDCNKFELTQQSLLIICILKKNKYFQLTFRIITQPMKNK